MPTITEAAVIHNLLTTNGIDAQLSEKASAGQAIATEVWVSRDDQADRAFELIKNMYSAEESEDSWSCGKCSEQNPGSFDLCWNCGNMRN